VSVTSSSGSAVDGKESARKHQELYGELQGALHPGGVIAIASYLGSSFWSNRCWMLFLNAACALGTSDTDGTQGPCSWLATTTVAGTLQPAALWFEPSWHIHSRTVWHSCPSHFCTSSNARSYRTVVFLRGAAAVGSRVRSSDGLPRDGIWRGASDEAAAPLWKLHRRLLCLRVHEVTDRLQTVFEAEVAAKFPLLSHQ